MTLEIREASLRADTEEGTVEGLAVPWDADATIGSYTERISRGAVQPGDIKFFWQHREVIGKVIETEDRDEGFWIKARISDTTVGRDALTLLRDGAVDKFSIGFEPVEHTDEEGKDGSLVRTRTKIAVREVSAVPFPAYSNASVSQVRENEGAKVSQVRATTTEKEKPPMAETVSKADLDEVRTGMEDLTRQVETSLATFTEKSTPTAQFRSIGGLIKAIASGDDTAIREYNQAFETRDWDGATSADTILRDGWIGSLVEVIKRRRPVLSTFASGALPATGLSVEYGVLETDTTQVGVQAAEGDDLAFGKVSIGTRNAPVVTLGGWSSLSRQAIERADVGILNVMWEALAEKYGQASEAYARQALTDALAATGGDALAEVEGDLTTQDGIVTAILDLAEHFDDEGRALDGVFVDKATFQALYAVPATDRVLQVSGAPADKVGTITVQTAQGNVAGLQFGLLPNADAGTVVAYDKTAIRTLEAPGAPFRLQDGNIINLTQDFSLYGYLSSFVQKRNGLVKVVEAAD